MKKALIICVLVMGAVFALSGMAAAIDFGGIEPTAARPGARAMTVSPSTQRNGFQLMSDVGGIQPE